MSLQIGNLNRMIDRLQKNGKDIAYEVAKYGEKRASEGFNDCMFNYTGDDYWVATSIEQDDKHSYVVAQGPNVAFIEFGTGVRFFGWLGDKLPKGIYPHGWYNAGETGRQSHGADPNGWAYKGTQGLGGYAMPAKDRQGHEKEGVYWTFGIPAGNAMYFAMNDMRDNAARITEEVLHRD